ncbi:MAG: glyoxalase [Gallionellaceae bacterium CG1_02_56_997]|nr:MAG: glyoxalase [Gallionellaceae bacterium CG1_02_56_997]PIV15176.1 MAG: glyoxalase [Gallionellales bacterium CG03_land_8_20_14_0_80_55_15]HCJ51547.1 glyoxalase [Gallionella sp.]
MILGIHHVTFLSADLSRSSGFYEGLLGLRADPKRPKMSFDGIWYDLVPEKSSGQQIHLMALPDPEAELQRPAHGGRDRHIALTVSDLQPLLERLERAGVAYTLSQSGRRALFCRDPDQNALEFIELKNA